MMKKKGKRIKIEGYLEEFALTKNEADDLIMNARNIVYKQARECKTSYSSFKL